MIYRRKAFANLLLWKNSDRRKPLIIRGARQVGKSTLIKEFAKEYEYFIDLNLERQFDIKLFQIGDVKDIISTLLLKNEIPDIRKTLLFIDEIQESSNAIKLLRYFYEDIPELHVICAGSLLEHALKNIKSFPVGRVQQMVLHPFDFEEFLMAKNKQQAIDIIKKIPFSDFAHDVLMDEFHEYLIIGGMPEVIKTYLETNSFVVIRDVYQEIWDTYKEDVEKYGQNSSEKRVLQHVIDTAASEKDRITMAGFGNSNYRSREIGEALRSLHKSRLIQLIYPTISTTPPIQIDLKRKPRLQFLDTGLLNYSLGYQAELITLKQSNDLYRGRIIQHIVSQQLQARNNSLSNNIMFWVREKANSNSEVDLVYQYKEYLIPIEVKSGASGRLRSLHEFIDRTNHNYAIRVLSNKLNIEKIKTIKGKAFLLLNLPIYLSNQIPEYVEWFIENHKL